MSRRDDVLEALRAAGGTGVSGTVLAAELGVSRMAVSKHVRTLREAGYEIVSRPGAGYALVNVADAPIPAEVARLLSSAMWVRLEGGGQTVSTNTDAATLARSGAPHGTAVLADRQTGGRGRLGRRWESPAGGVYVSAVLRPPLAPSALGGLSIAVAAGIAGALREQGIAPAVKWPNDVLLGQGKLAGILLEMAAETDRTEWVVVGVGLNVKRPAAPLPGAAYLADEVPDFGLARGAAIVLDGIAAGYQMLIEGGMDAVAAAFEPLDVLRGREVRVSDVSGAERARGIASGIDGDGRLRVDCGSGAVVALAAGDVTLGDAGRFNT
ncbi:MAG: biotin--[acetyl-CoA-carboxylase] ligase [Clostridiales bacterium]|nr:biotin--[acetyl-CoA-carboxylase] ligase [Clostridiales bacterium]